MGEPSSSGKKWASTALCVCGHEKREHTTRAGKPIGCLHRGVDRERFCKCQEFRLKQEKATVA